MDDYKLANIIDNSRHIQQKINSPFRSALTIYERARNSKNYYNINARSPLKNRGFEKAIYNSPIGLYYHCPLIYNIIGKCFRNQENMY